MLAISAPVIVGFAGLAVDYNVWKKEQTALDRVTESAAMAAAFAKSKGVDDVLPYAIADATRNGYDDTRETLSVAFENGSITVDIERLSDRYLSSILTQDPVVISAKAEVELVEVDEVITVENEGVGSGYACITALDSNPVNQRGIYMHNNGFIEAENCGVHSNSQDRESDGGNERASIYMRNAHIEADFIRSVGETVVNSSNGYTTTNVEPVSGANAFIDPFANLTPPVAGACDNQGHTVNYVPEPEVLQPGTYCGDIIVQNGGSARFAPGLYHIVNGDLLVRGGVSIHDSEDVTFYFGGNNPGKWVIDNGTDVTLSAPTHGDTAGMLFWQSPDVQCTNNTYNYNNPGQNKFAGGVNFEFDGVIYAPNCGIVIDNNAQLSPSGDDAHMSMHAGWIEIRGNARLSTHSAPAAADLVAETEYTTVTTTTEVVVTNVIPELRFAQ